MEFETRSRVVELFGIDETAHRKMTFAASGKMFYVVMAGLYSRKVESIVRESCANARDGHTKRGNVARPFNVHAPNRWEPHYAVRDYGCSMDHETVMTLYSQIGWSSKEGSNDEIGTFGLGSKAPFAYTSQFTLTCWLAGERRTYNCHLGAGGEPQVALMERVPSDEEQGVCVSFDVKEPDFRAFHEAIDFVAMAHRPCFECNRNVASATITADHGTFYTIEDHTGPWVEIGCVWYKIDIAQVFPDDAPEKLVQFQRRTVIRTRIGDLSVVPSREGLEYTPRTIANLRKTITEMYQGARDEVAAKVATLTSQWDAACYFMSLSGYAAAVARDAPTPWGILWDSRDAIITGHGFNENTKTLHRHSLTVKPFNLRLIRGDKFGVYVLDETSAMLPNRVHARIRADLDVRDLAVGHLVTLPDPMRRQREAVDRNKDLSRAERKIKNKDVYTRAKEARAAIMATLDEIGCPVRVDVTSLPEPQTKPTARSERIPVYRHRRDNTWEGIADHVAKKDTVTLVAPLDRRSFAVPSIDASKVYKITKALGLQMHKLIGVARSNLQAFLAQHDDCFEIGSFLTEHAPPLDDIAAVYREQYAAHAPTGLKYSGDQIARHCCQLRPYADVLPTALRRVLDMVQDYKLSREYVSRESAALLNAKGTTGIYALSLDELRLLAKLIRPGIELEGASALAVLERAIEDQAAAVFAAYPSLPKKLSISATSGVEAVTYILGTDALRAHQAVTFAEQQSLHAA